MSTTATPDPLYIWFRKIGATLSDEDYEEGVSALASHDAEVAAKTLEGAADDLGMERRLETRWDHRQASLDWLRARAATIRKEKP